ncbi:threonylcarbamoyl-AMP synthase [Candidatus Woesebacteria bacterium RIFCSPLOWO2_01_FULL_39_61]|uniref:L-threonylcarbamoyladenylate synthase n=1 Tax=Candidatus Woesebacteria bacterium RIFCSPHIGHO2_02_FULL_39_13 TaxID=1802505 RepID=A0A1F7Z527_9BACT|nr:MAG: threonylcarbamoyl-AMP synthase [Candidatus Woesebacteria bacterium RIFCSPHIGHO2_01_FULL_39_95]OGM34561.1 MAG: threonylcarbamoyl-AMP synthase [Candidatus Woesebacteria bacterium RIFCSPHIGHO2_02_FULL_39_13]OGM38828.1 MAG: threonylcarbamoyl-AMP synthase [Candidatus Woesebacteria bacterium RIFCSPHIGHO2_12_FULL_40_20]OGM65834.1 MAG: threonylcarbamoyl-AMP synthase [Candidatus Woesebacteria bacterium RIFCSPLOWO2_01_FULL_39_61]OGM71648.1 MAG: threonylcarbamoyl-AMP synthase [Candidatus Woesebact
MEIIKIEGTKPNELEVEKIKSFLDKGKIVVLPTETVYTFATDATNLDALKKIYELKGRDFSKPLHVVVSSIRMAQKYVYITPIAEKLAKRFLPGPLTLVLKKKKGRLPDLLTSNLPTLGIRIPDLPLNKIVSEKLKVPYTTTSANISGEANPYSIEQVLKQLSKEKQTFVDLMVDVGSLPQLKPSTLIDLTQSPPKILREGPISKKDLEKVIGKVI